MRVTAGRGAGQCGGGGGAAIGGSKHQALNGTRVKHA